MHFESCSLKAFGQFKEVRFDKLSERIVVLLGPNEAGKSTFFKFLQTMLYGVYPTNPEKHIYVPRDGAALEGSATIRLSDGSEIEISRRLARIPQGHLTNGTEVDLRNKALPGADFISGQVFDAVYALDLHDMTGLQGRAWADVQDRLLGGMNLDFLRSARNVIDEIEREANELWRPDRRGRPVERRLREEREEISARLSEARQREVELQKLASEIEAGERRLRALKDKLPALQAEARRLDRVGPIAIRWKKMESFRQEAGEIKAYRHVPENPAAILKEWHRRDDEYLAHLKEIEQQIEQSEFDQLAVSDRDQLAVRHADEIRGWSKRAGVHEANLIILGNTGISICNLQIEALRLARDVAGSHRAGGLLRDIRTWDAGPIKRAMEGLDDMRERVALLESRDADLQDMIHRRRPFVPVGVIAVGAVLAAIGVIQMIAPLWMAGGVIGLAGIVWLAFELARTSSLRSERDRLNLQKSQSELQAARAAVDTELEKLGLSTERGEWPDRGLISALDTLEELESRRRQAVSQARGMAAILYADRAAVQQLAAACEMRMNLDVIDTVNHLQTELENSTERVRRAETAKQRLFRLQHDRERIIADRQALVDQIVQVEAAIEDLGAGDLAQGISVLEARRRARLRADHEEATLDKDHPGWRDFEHELFALTDEDLSQFSEEAKQAREAELDEIRQEISFEQVRSGRKGNELNMLLKNETPDGIESRIESIDDQLTRVRQRRDRLVLLANILRRADQQFRYKHQPDVIRKASEYLEKITAGRYHKMIIEEEDQRLLVFQKGSGFPIEVDESLSQGTRDQVYLSIRFALMDHLDAHQERLPAFLDEVFVNWDEDRRMLGYEILKDLAGRRQVFVFTCHPWMADELESVVTAQRIEL